MRALGAKAFALVHAVGLQRSVAGARYAARAMAGVYVGDARPHTGQRGGMIYFPELGTVVVSASYVVDEHAFPVVDQDKFSSGAQVPARPVSLVPVAAAGPTPAAADSGDGGGEYCCRCCRRRRRRRISRRCHQCTATLQSSHRYRLNPSHLTKQTMRLPLTWSP